MLQSVQLLRPAGPILIFGGPYSNREATEAVLAEAARIGIPAERTICTGDVVAYGADPVATVRLVRESGLHVIMGNCEESLARGASDCGCGFPAESACQQLSSAWFQYADWQLGSDERAWMAALPHRIDIEIGGTQLAIVHGSVSQINRFIFASTAALTKRQELDVAGVDGIIAGHCGIPFTQVIDGRLWHNAGAIGMPANDGTPRVWCSIISPSGSGLTIEHRCLSYDHAAASAKMRRVGLPEGYACALGTGIWPSSDVLPLLEIRQRGVPLEPGRTLWRPHPQRQPRPVRRGSIACEQLWPLAQHGVMTRLHPGKFSDPDVTATGRRRAIVPLGQLKTVWFNTGTLCNITCRNCYIESSPRNDRLVYLTRGEVAAFLDEIERDRLGTVEIGFTGGEPFMNPEFTDMLDDCLSRGFRALVLTNAMRPMQRVKAQLIEINERHGGKLTLRVSLDHYTSERHDDERGPGTFRPALDGLLWLVRSGFRVAVAGRTMWGEDLEAERAGYARLFADYRIPIDAFDPAALVLFPEMDPGADVPEITTDCWDILGKSPADVMCATSRMVVKRRGADRPVVLACTLIPYDPQFELGATLGEAARSVPLNHPHCSKFCVLGGASCSPASPEHRATAASVRKSLADADA